MTDKVTESAVAVAKDLGAEHPHLDVATVADRAALAKVWPVCDVVVNNEGLTGFEDGMRPHDPENASLKDWKAVHAINLHGSFLGCR